MITIIDSFDQLDLVFDEQGFHLDKWRVYIQTLFGKDIDLFEEEMNTYLESGEYTYEQDFLPILNAVSHSSKLKLLHDSFLKVTSTLEWRMKEVGLCDVNVNIVLYMGLCNGAGWVTRIHDQEMILLGIEKIIELNWCDQKNMIGLIYHELGHVYHDQHGHMNQTSDDSSKNFIWQLFCEGIAMVVEQKLVGDESFYHQDHDGWQIWCETHLNQIAHDFHQDKETMTQMDQRYFGDWCKYDGWGDVGYYLGCRFVYFMMKTVSFDELICLSLDRVCEYYEQFISEIAL